MLQKNFKKILILRKKRKYYRINLDVKILVGLIFICITINVCFDNKKNWSNVLKIDFQKYYEIYLDDNNIDNFRSRQDI